MRKKLRLTLAAAAALIGASSLMAQTAAAFEPIVPDPEVRTGTLPNGLTYYVKRNASPAQRVDFFIAQRVGSVQETDDQRGLAHFLEHMCFNGTKNFPGNSLITWLESVGVKFGANLNAYTSTDETVYNICNVPSARRSTLDSCFMILGDWGHNLLLKGKDIDAERGVIEGEWRQRSGAMSRMMERALPALYPGSPYANRMPIGTMQVVRNFKHSTLRDYYKRWYHPYNQAIIVVGDIDPDYAVEQITKQFGKVKAPKGAAAVQPAAVPGNDRLLVAVESDSELGQPIVRLMYKHAGLSAEQAATSQFFQEHFFSFAATRMLSERFADLAKEPDAPFTRVRVSDKSYMMSKHQPALQTLAYAKQGHEAAAVQAMAAEVNRARRHGFTATELRRAQVAYGAMLDNMLATRDTYSNTQIARDLVRTYLQGEPMPSIPHQVDLCRKVLAQATLEQLNAWFGGITTDTGRDVAVAVFCSEGSVPTAAQVSDAYGAAARMQLAAYVDSLKSSQLLDQLPAPGKIVSEQAIPHLDAQLWTLSNGARVYVKPTAIKAGEVAIYAAAPGGVSQTYTPSQVPDVKSINSVMAASAYGAHTASDLKKLLTGKDVSVSTFVNRTEQGLQGSANRADLETEFQLIYLKLTSPQKDEKAFNQFLEANRARVKNQADPKFEFADSIFAHVFDRHPLGVEKLTASEIDQVNYDNIMAIYKDRFADVNNMRFIIVGDFDTDSLRALVEQYVASLPGHGRVEKPRDIGYRLFPESKDVAWTSPMTNPQSKLYMFHTIEGDYNPHDQLVAKVAGQIVSYILRQEIREDRGWTYHIDTRANFVPDMNGQDAPVLYMPLNVTLTVGKAGETRQVIENTLKDIAANGVSDEQLNKVKKYYTKVHGENLDDNSYWLSMLNQHAKYGLDFHTGYLDLLNSVTSADVQQFIANLLANGRRLTLQMDPKE